MKYVICSVRDQAADIFGQPFYSASTGTAVRAFTDEVNRKAENNQLNAHPEDFALFMLGTFDDADASFDVGKPRQLALAKDVLRA